jgi:aspartyl/asparaginyl beta-hydroxylase (cupin superfamily)
MPVWTWICCILLICIIIIIICIRFCSGHTIAGYINHILSYFIDENRKYYHTNKQWCEELRQNYHIILEEYYNYSKQYKIPRCSALDEIQSIIDTSDIPWNVLFLRLFNKDTDKIKYFPKTYELISKIPNCSLAMFSILPPGKKMPPHVGIYKGVLRYHLALKTPHDPRQCYIVVNDKKYNWEEGHDVLFDDTYTHYVNNESSETRIVLLLDIKREFNNIIVDNINNILLYFAKYNTLVDQIVTNINNS